MAIVQKFLLSILVAQLVLIVFFGVFQFERITVALYFGMWIGIASAWFFLKRANVGRYAKVLGGMFSLQTGVFIGLELAEMNDLFLEEAGFLSIGAWIGILVGMLLNTIETLEQRFAGVEAQQSEQTSDD